MSDMTGEAGVPASREIVLLGGGHAHAQVVKMLRMRKPPDTRVTLISDGPTAYYSGMLPACIAGLYTPEEIQIDLVRLSRWAGARFIQARAESIDPKARQVILEGRPPVAYDLLSINIGSTTRGNQVPGAARHAISTRPLSLFMRRLEEEEERCRSLGRGLRVAVVGGGAAGVELAFALQRKFQNDGIAPGVVLIEGGAGILAERSRAAAKLARRVLAERGIEVAAGSPVERVDPDAVVLAGGRRIPYDLAVWATGGAPPAFLARTGLETDEAGFLKVSPALQTSSPDVFAAGDCVSVAGHASLPKAGVYAVREGPVLSGNLLARLENRPLRPYHPQKGFLSLLMTGDRKAIMDWKGIALHGAWAWSWKDWIDRRWMRKFDPAWLEARDSGGAPSEGDAMRCAGCGAKVGPGVLGEALGRLAAQNHPRVVLGLDAREDAAAVRVPAGKIQLQSIDYFPAFVDDPYLLGRIAAVHAASDLFAMGAQPETALVLATIPHAHPRIVGRELGQLMAGVAEEARKMGMAIVGGHTSEGDTLAVGLSVTGLADPDKLLRKGGLKAGDALVLTKPLGTGTLLAADMRGRARGEWMQGAFASMLQSNGPAMEILLAHGVRGATDVTGFGLGGHLAEMLSASGAGCALDLTAIPLLPGAAECLKNGIKSTLDPDNRAQFQGNWTVSGKDAGAADILYDPQTSGGLLAGVPACAAETAVAQLRAFGFTQAAVIGEVTPLAGTIELR